jgi:hypothetical protein
VVARHDRFSRRIAAARQLLAMQAALRERTGGGLAFVTFRNRRKDPPCQLSRRIPRPSSWCRQALTSSRQSKRKQITTEAAHTVSCRNMRNFVPVVVGLHEAASRERLSDDLTYSTIHLGKTQQNIQAILTGNRDMGQRSRPL